MGLSAFQIELDEVTLARARRGDLSACESIFRLYSSPAYTLALRICQCPHRAQDATQEAFIKALRSLQQFRGDAPFWGWLRRVVVNQAISIMRREWGAETVEFEESHVQSAAETGNRDLALDLEAALAALDAVDRTVVWLHDVEGYGHAEIAEVFGLSESFSKTRLARAHGRLRKLLEPGHDGNPPIRTVAARLVESSPATEDEPQTRVACLPASGN